MNALYRRGWAHLVNFKARGVIWCWPLYWCPTSRPLHRCRNNSLHRPLHRAFCVTLHDLVVVTLHRAFDMLSWSLTRLRSRGGKRAYRELTGVEGWQLLVCVALAIAGCLTNHVASWLWAHLRRMAIPLATRHLANVPARLRAGAAELAHRLAACCNATWTILRWALRPAACHCTMWLVTLHHATIDLRTSTPGLAAGWLACGFTYLVATWRVALPRALRCTRAMLWAVSTCGSACRPNWSTGLAALSLCVVKCSRA